MQMKYYLLIAFLAIIPMMTAQCQQPEDHCRYFYEELKNVPHEKLEYHKGFITFSWDNEKYKGCEINFITNDSLLTEGDKLPAFSRGLIEETPLYQRGWRFNINYTADGPGTHLFGIEKRDTLCLIYYAQPATLEEPGKIVQDSELTITVECVKKEAE